MMQAKYAMYLDAPDYMRVQPRKDYAFDQAVAWAIGVNSFPLAVLNTIQRLWLG